MPHQEEPVTLTQSQVDELWMIKTKMIQLRNRFNGRDANEFQSHVLEHKAIFDAQAWDMFANCVIINIDKMKEDVAFWKEVYAHLKLIDCNDPKFGFRSGMRIAMIQTICEEELHLNNQ